MLKKTAFPKYRGPVLVVVMDGVGLCGREAGNAVKQAYTPTLDRLFATYPNTRLKAHGKAVGLPSDEDMGNSEVGHNAMGAGKVYEQGAMLVNSAIETGKMFESAVWKELTARCGGGGAGAPSAPAGVGVLHFIGLFSDGNVHSHIDHLKAMIVRAKADGVKRVRVHILLDGRDVGETSALEYVEPFERFLAEVSADGGFSARIASGGGRMKITMDRYEANWGMVELGWQTHVRAEGRKFPSAKAAIETFRSEAKVIDQDLPPFVVADGETPIGPITDGDSVIFYNFRGDRAIEISRAFTDREFTKFGRGPLPDVAYAGMLEYDGDLHIPQKYLVSPPEIRDTLGEHLCASGVRQLAISETQKFGHVTYFWNGNRSGKFDERLETYIEVPSDVIPFEQRPWMKAAEATDALISELRTGGYAFARVNFANGDMVGHTGDFLATRIAVETVDLCLARLLPVIDELGGMAIITADHGNADEMYELDKKTGAPAKNKDGSLKAKTSHTLNPVPCIFYDNANPAAYALSPAALESGSGGSSASGGSDSAPAFGLSNLASTVATLLGFEPLPGWDAPIILPR
ncbi:MAG: 2,3-bisphosphoglycerate-independent phosphoglycerate mutase [Clostridiales bacterium]|jgi:2,3-bisphosphoglycerate-independent phosphoglycerate mutase|nr:2,3-bisphosphoglycerate-independent phosphoglycerate mutase [Clostridiales bacterium]